MADLITILIALLMPLEVIMMAPIITYSRLELLGLMPPKCELPLSTYQTLKELRICGVVPTQRGTRGGRFLKSMELGLDNVSRNNIHSAANDCTNCCNLGLWNAQSVGNKTADICEYVTYHDIDILCLTETWMKDEDPVVIGEMSPPGYTFINVPRTSGDDHHGGIGILHKSQLSLGRVTNNDLPQFDSFEFTIVSNSSHSLYIILVYRPYPSAQNGLTTAQFLDEFDSFLDHVNLLPGKVLLLGDFNIHVNHPEKSEVNRFLSGLSDIGMEQHVDKPTHRCGNTLDLLVTRQGDDLIKSVTVDNRTFTKDHYFINCTLNVSKPTAIKTTQTIRKYKNIDHEAFSKDLSDKMSVIMKTDYEDVNLLLKDFNSSCTEVLDTHAPSTTRKRTVRHRPGWYGDSIDNARRERRRYERKWRQSGSSEDRVKYELAKESVKSTVTESKTEYYHERFENCSTKDMYRNVRDLLNQNSRPVPDTSSPHKLANEFGEFFIGKVDNIRNEVDMLGSEYSRNDSECCNLNNATPIVSSDIPLLSEFKKVSEENLLQIINKCPNKSCDLDVLPTWLLKQHSSVVLPPLTKIVNMSLASGTFPSDLTNAIITPVLKKPSLDKNELKHYRPVANLPFISKVTEKCVANQVNDHVNSHDLGEPMQSAYKAKHSTETALAYVHNDFMRALDDQKVTFLIMLDLSAAFDTVDSEILLQKLYQDFRITGTVQSWFKSYLTDRSFRVFVSGAYSKNITLKYGIPQGSVIGPLGFVFYTHAVGHILRKHNLKYHIYADDIQIYIVVDPNIPGDVACALFKLSQCIIEINQWMIQNKLKLNPDKTEFFIVSSPHHMDRLQNLSLHINDTLIPASSSVRNLGVTFDTNMTLSQHVTNLSKSVNWQIRNIHRIRQFIDQDTCANIVRSLIVNRLDNYNLMFNGLSKTDLSRLQKLQNKAARLIYQQPKRCHITPLLTDLHWLRIEDRIKYKLLLSVYKCLNGLCPQYLCDCLKVHGPRPDSVITRSCHGFDLIIPRTTKSAGDKAFSVAGPTLWNNIPIKIRKSPTVDSFKTCLKTHLFQHASN